MNFHKLPVFTALRLFVKAQCVERKAGGKWEEWREQCLSRLYSKWFVLTGHYYHHLIPWVLGALRTLALLSFLCPFPIVWYRIPLMSSSMSCFCACFCPPIEQTKHCESFHFLSRNDKRSIPKLQINSLGFPSSTNFCVAQTFTISLPPGTSLVPKNWSLTSVAIPS